MSRNASKTILTVLVFLAAGVLLGGCASQNPQNQQNQAATATPSTPNALASVSVTASPTPSSVASNQQSFLKGFALTPKSFAAADFNDFFEKARQANEASGASGIVSWAGDWSELAKTEGGGPRVVAELAAQKNFVPLVQAQFFTQSSGALLRPLNEANKAAYENAAVAFAEKYEPKYFAFGIEVNALYEKSPGDFDEFAAFYAEVYDAVKQASPHTKVFVVFQLEKMKGLGGGLFGGANDEAKNEWALLERFPKNDLFAFTTYPSLVFKNPSEIPSDYYSELSYRAGGKPIAFTEVGWHSTASPQGWESSESEQAEFVTRFFELTQGMRKEFVVWSFLYDQSAASAPFNSMGLIRGDGESGSEKQAWNAWVNAK